jgi:hypothetical protein
MAITPQSIYETRTSAASASLESCSECRHLILELLEGETLPAHLFQGLRLVHRSKVAIRQDAPDLLVRVGFGDLHRVDLFLDARLLSLSALDRAGALPFGRLEAGIELFQLLLERTACSRRAPESSRAI